VWICIDGTEGSGKTTLANALSGQVASVSINEFSEACFGQALRKAVEQTPHFISESALGQSLVFLGDFIELFDSRIKPALEAGQVVITDRGWLSKYAYQRTVLERTMTAGQADNLLTHVLSFVPKPDLTILLTAPAERIRERLLGRDGHCSEDRLEFIKKATAVAVAYAKGTGLPHVLIDTDRPAADVGALGAAAVAAAVRRPRGEG
jgi:dTMP kinase